MLLFLPDKWYNIYGGERTAMQMNTEFTEDNLLGERKKEDKEFFVYILRCRDNTFYTGYSDDLAKRLKAHNSGRGAKYTKSRLPVEIVYYEDKMSKSEAMRRECAIKKLSRKKKEELIAQHARKGEDNG